MAVTVRDAIPGDTPSLEIVRRQAIESSFSSSFDRTTYADMVARPDAELPEQINQDRWVVRLAETPVTPVTYAVADTTTNELLSIYTSPDYERRGYARRVFESLEHDLGSPITATVPEPALGFFRAIGFHPTGVTHQIGIPHVEMEKAD